VQRVCFGCKSKDEYEEVRLARRGKIFTYAEDYLSETPTPPEIRAVVMLADGARVCVTLTEAEAQASSDRPEKLGMPVEMTLRKVDDASGVHNYYWKAKPIRGGN
jgi:uncharacterized OB-fold protein